MLYFIYARFNFFWKKQDPNLSCLLNFFDVERILKAKMFSAIFRHLIMFYSNRMCFLKRFCLFACLLLSSYLFSQKQALEGQWSGALIRTGNSVQLMHVLVESQSDSLLTILNVPDWSYYDADAL
jgi:hypothetical protein